MKLKIAAGLILGFAFQLSAHAGSLQATGTDQTIGLNMSQNIFGPLNFDLGYMHNFNNSSELATAGLHLDMGLGPVAGMVGVKGYYADVGGQNGKGYAPGVGFSVSPIPLFSLVGSYYYSDGRFSNDNDIERYRDWALTANFHPLSLTNLFVGYGFKSVEMKGGHETIMNDGAIVGVSLNF
jgi:hypothetical protein